MSFNRRHWMGLLFLSFSGASSAAEILSSAALGETLLQADAVDFYEPPTTLSDYGFSQVTVADTADAKVPSALTVSGVPGGTVDAASQIASGDLLTYRSEEFVRTQETPEPSPVVLVICGIILIVCGWLRPRPEWRFLQTSAKRTEGQEDRS